MAVLPLAKSTARAQIEKVQSTLRDERRNENTRHSGSAQGLELCAFVRWHGTWPDSWQLSFLFTGISVIRPALRSRIQVPRPQPFPRLRWPSARIGIRIALPRAERMLTMRVARAKVSRAGSIGREITQPRRVTQWKQSDCWSHSKHARAKRTMPKHF